MFAIWRQLSIWDKITLTLGLFFFVVAVALAGLGTVIIYHGTMGAGTHGGGNREYVFAGFWMFAISLAPALASVVIAVFLRSRVPVGLYRTLLAPIVIALLSAAVLEVLSGR